MAKNSKAAADTTTPPPKTVVSPTSNKNHHARLIYKSGASQDLTILAQSTNAFEIMRSDFLKHQISDTPKAAWYTVGKGVIALDWGEVVSIHTWIV